MGSSSSDTSHYENRQVGEANVPFEVPEGWSWCSVEDVFELNPKNKVEDNVICGFIPMALVEDGFGYSHSFEERSWGEVKKGYCHFQNGDIGIAKISPCFENRKSTIFSSLPNGIGAGTTELSILRGSLVDCRFFLFLFQTEWYLREGTKYFKGVVGQQRVNKEIFTTLQIPLPPLAEQRRIANAIETYMSLCSEIDEYRDGVHSAIIASKSKILDLAIHGKLVPQDANDEPASDLLRRINPKAVSSCDNPHYVGEIPRNWVWTTLGSIGKWQSGGTPSRMHKEYYGGNIPWLKTGDLNDGLVTDIPEHITELGLENSSAKLNPAGSVLIAMYGATIGKVGVLGIPATTNQACCACIEYKGITQQYLFLFLLANKANFVAAGGGGAQPNISKEIITKTLLPLPPIEEQNRIVAKVKELVSQLDMIEESLKK